MSKLYIMKDRCNECLFGSNALVDKERRQNILLDCMETDRHFICHKASLKNRDVVCRGFFDSNLNCNPGLRFAKRYPDLLIKEVTIEELGE